MRLNIKDEVTALDMDNAVSLRLLQFDAEQMKQNARLTAYEVSKIFSTEKQQDGGNYEDANTETW